MKHKLKLVEIPEILNIEKVNFPKYTTQIINLASQNAQATRPKAVGQLSDLINNISPKTHTEWKKYYLENYGDRIDIATEKIAKMIDALKIAINQIDEQLIREWVYDLIINKTAEGLLIQEPILKYLSDLYKTDYRLSNAEEESKGIDGFLGNLPIQIKAISYKSNTNVKNESFDNILMIYYEKTKTALNIEYDEEFLRKHLK